MDARKKAAAVSAAGVLLIAGCAGGKGLGGASLPSAGGTQQIAIPANSSKIAMRFAAPARKIAGWVKPTRVLPATSKTRKTKVRNSVRLAASAVRAPKYISPAVVGGNVVISIYQNGASAFPNQTLAVGTSTTSPIYCTYSTTLYEYECYNNPPYGNVYAPLGNDTFYVAMYDAQNRLLSITPGLPGFNGASAPTPYTVTSAGGTVNAYTYGVVSTVGIETSTGCLTPTFGGWAADILFFDADGAVVNGPLANPVTLTTSGINLYSSYLGAPVASSYTVYNSSIDAWFLVPAADGASGSISTGNVAINNGATSLNIYAVDRYAVAPVGGGTLSLLGLYDGGPTTFVCAAPTLATYDTASPIVLSNPRGIVSNDNGPLIGVVDVATSTVVDAIDMIQYDFGFTDNGTFDAAVPVSQVAFAGTNPIDETISSYNSKIYVLDASGNVEAVDYSSFAPGLGQGTSSAGTFASGTTSPTSIAAFLNPGNSTDSLLVGNSGSSSIFEIDQVPNAPFPSSLDLSNPLLGFGLDSGTQTTAAYTDSNTGSVLLRVVDSDVFRLFECNTGLIGTYIQSNLLGSLAICTVYGQQTLSGLGTASIASGSGGAGSIGLASGGAVYLTAGAGTMEQVLEGPPPISTGTISGFPGTPTRMSSAYDVFWVGVVSGTAINVFHPGIPTPLGTFSGAYVTVVSPPVQAF